MATTLLAGITRKFDTSSITATVSSGLYVGTYPENTSLPFVVLLHLGEVPEWSMESVYTEISRVQFHCFAVGLANCETIASTLKSTFDWCDLQINDATTISCKRTGYFIAADEQRSSQADLVYRAQVDYTIEVRRTLPGS